MQQAARQKEQGEELTPAKIDWQDFVVVETIDFAVDEKVLTLPPPPSSMLSAKNAKPNAAPQQQRPDVPYNDDDDDEQIRVVPTYTPKIAGAGNQNVDQLVIDPITGKTVRVQDLPEHMRIQLLDPKWAEERKKFQDKLKDSNLVSGDMVASNLERLGYGAKRDQDLLSSSKRTYDEAELKRPAGPSFPGMPAASARSAAASLSEDTAKRARVEGAGPVDGSQPGTAQGAANAPPPPPPPPPPPAQPPAPPPEHPFAAAIGGASNTELANRGGDDELLSEADFAASLAKPTVTLQVRVPNDAAQMAWNFYGQIVSLAVDVMLNVKTVKQQLATTHLNGMPANKIQLKNTATGAFLKDNMTLAALNIGPSATLELTAKKRGGRK